MKKYNIYKTTNLVNGNFYWGVHDSIDENDGYFGSGEVLLKAVKKHGKENFRRVTKLLYDTADEAFADERLIVNKKMVSRSDCYNACEGGRGGNGGPNRVGMKNTEEAKNKLRKTLSDGRRKGRGNPFYGKKHTRCAIRKMRNAMTGKKLSEETKQKLRITSTGQNNPMSKTNRRLREKL